MRCFYGFLALLLGCSPGSKGTPADGFDRPAMLKNLAENVIYPAVLDASELDAGSPGVAPLQSASSSLRARSRISRTLSALSKPEREAARKAALESLPQLPQISAVSGPMFTPQSFHP